MTDQIRSTTSRYFPYCFTSFFGKAFSGMAACVGM
jgi:hypothetical protein